MSWLTNQHPWAVGVRLLVAHEVSSPDVASVQPTPWRSAQPDDVTLRLPGTAYRRKIGALIFDSPFVGSSGNSRCGRLRSRPLRLFSALHRCTARQSTPEPLLAP